MPIPTHRADCERKMYPTHCPDCGDEVFYFSCSCGSKVFFDLPYPPWNDHGDRCLKYLIRVMIEIEHVPENQICSLVEEESHLRGIPISADVRRILDEIDDRVSKKLIVSETQPQDKPLQVVGKIMSVNANVNFFKRFDYPDNLMGRALLGRLVSEPYVELIIREDGDRENRCRQFHAFQVRRDFEKLALNPVTRIRAMLNPYTVVEDRRIWLVETLEQLLRID